ncbi:MAG TPA: methyltransferase [Chloroflexota bacterium]|nr:methyltransferase [Chloroflexota bacterium]
MPDTSRTNDAEREAEIASAHRLMDLVLGMWWSRAVYVAADLRLADYLADGAKDVETLARLTHTHAPSLYRLLRFLTGMGVFAEREPGVFSQSPLSALLRSDLATSVRDDVLLQGDDWHWQAWGALGHTVRTGEPAIDHLFGEDLFGYFAHQNPEAGRLFHRTLSSERHESVLEAYDFSVTDLVVDVGGGQGTLLSALLETYPAVHGILFDRPEVIDALGARKTEMGLNERVALISGDFFSSVPPADVYLLRNIIHDWSDDEAATILTACRAAMNEGGRILVIEQIVPEWDSWSSIKFGDLEMMVLIHGRERTASEFRSLFQTVGLRLDRIIPTSSELRILEGLPS